MTEPLVLVVTEHWGESTEESGVVTRLVAGALARRARGRDGIAVRLA